MCLPPGWLVCLVQVEWDTDPGTREVQWVKTYADTGPNEMQSITTSANDVDEVQGLITSANETQEIQVRGDRATQILIVSIHLKTCWRLMSVFCVIYVSKVLQQLMSYYLWCLWRRSGFTANMKHPSLQSPSAASQAPLLVNDCAYATVSYVTHTSVARVTAHDLLHASINEYDTRKNIGTAIMMCFRVCDTAAAHSIELILEWKVC